MKLLLFMVMLMNWKVITVSLDHSSNILDQDYDEYTDNVQNFNANNEVGDGMLDWINTLVHLVLNQHHLPPSKKLAIDLLQFPVPPQLDFSDQKASKASVVLVRKYLEDNPTYPLQEKIKTNLNEQIIPKLCEGDYQLQPSLKGYTVFDAKVIPWHGKEGGYDSKQIIPE